MRTLKIRTVVIASMCLAVIAFTASTSDDHGHSLKDAFQEKFLIGVALNRSQIYQRNAEESRLISSQFNAVTAENEMKWMNIHPQKDQYNFEHADKFVALAESNHMFAVGHTLVWHKQLAPWVLKSDDGGEIDSAELISRIKGHVQTIVGRYKGKVKGWDVVNEALDEDGSLRKSEFLKIAGPDYIARAFQFARQADPAAQLYYNDFNLANPAKRDGAIRLIKDLQRMGIRIDAVGMQAHWHLRYPSLEEIEKAITMFGDLGIQVMFTELDVSVLPTPSRKPSADVSSRFENTPELDPYVTGLPDSVQHQLAERYASIFKLFSRHADKISRVTFWGLHDGVSWKNNFPVRRRTDYPLLFDRQLKPKEAYQAVIDVAREKD
jgi:endo-1,4-beta-xylanase